MQKQDRRFAEKFAWRLRRRMEYLGISQTDLSKKSGVHKATIHALYHGVEVPRADTVANLARALGMSTDDLIMFND